MELDWLQLHMHGHRREFSISSSPVETPSHRNKCTSQTLRMNLGAPPSKKFLTPKLQSLCMNIYISLMNTTNKRKLFWIWRIHRQQSAARSDCALIYLVWWSRISIAFIGTMVLKNTRTWVWWVFLIIYALGWSWDIGRSCQCHSGTRRCMEEHT